MTQKAQATGAVSVAVLQSGGWLRTAGLHMHFSRCGFRRLLFGEKPLMVVAAEPSHFPGHSSFCVSFHFVEGGDQLPSANGDLSRHPSVAACACCNGRLIKCLIDLGHEQPRPALGNARFLSAAAQRPSAIDGFQQVRLSGAETGATFKFDLELQASALARRCWLMAPS